MHHYNADVVALIVSALYSLHVVWTKLLYSRGRAVY